MLSSFGQFHTPEFPRRQFHCSNELQDEVLYFSLLLSSVLLFTSISTFHSLLFSGVTLSTETWACTYAILSCPPLLATYTWFEYSYTRIDSLILATLSYEDPSSRVGVACQVPSLGHPWPFTWHVAVLMESYSFHIVICETELAEIALMNMHLQNWSHCRKSSSYTSTVLA